MLYVTPTDRAMTLGQRIVVFNEGRSSDRHADALYDEPANLFVAGAQGSPPGR